MFYKDRELEGRGLRNIGFFSLRIFSMSLGQRLEGVKLGSRVQKVILGWEGVVLDLVRVVYIFFCNLLQLLVIFSFVY